MTDNLLLCIEWNIYKFITLPFISFIGDWASERNREKIKYLNALTNNLLNVFCIINFSLCMQISRKVFYGRGLYISCIYKYCLLWKKINVVKKKKKKKKPTKE